MKNKTKQSKNNKKTMIKMDFGTIAGDSKLTIGTKINIRWFILKI